MKVGDMIEYLVFGVLLGKLKCDDPVPPELIEGRHEDPVEYLKRKVGENEYKGHIPQRLWN